MKLLRATVAPVTALAVLLVAGCGRGGGGDFEDQTARVTVDGRVTTFTLDACGLDQQVAYLVGKAADGTLLQAVVGVEADGETGVPAESGFTVTSTDDDPSYAAFGPDAWVARGQTGVAPGTIDSARIKGSRIQAQGEARPVDVQDRPTTGPAVAVELDARCDAEDQD